MIAKTNQNESLAQKKIKFNYIAYNFQVNKNKKS